MKYQHLAASKWYMKGIAILASAICLHSYAESGQPTIGGVSTPNSGQTNSSKADSGNESEQKNPEQGPTPSSPPSPPRAELGEAPRLPR